MALQSSAERRLQKLREQQEAIAQKIKQVEQEKAKELRKVRLKRQSLIGAVVMEMLERGEEVVLGSEADLLALMEQALVKKTERQAFGLSLDVPSSETEKKPKKPANEKPEKPDADATAPPPTEPSKGKKASSPKSNKRLAESGTQKEMMEEFNV